MTLLEFAQIAILILVGIGIMVAGSKNRVVEVPKMYKVDWDKVQTAEDIRLVFKAIHPNIQLSENSPLFEKMKHILKETE
jgi:hypothetical protein